MDLSALAPLVERYGLSVVMLCAALWALKRVFELLIASLESRAKDGEKIATAMERNTTALDALRELIKERVQ